MVGQYIPDRGDVVWISLNPQAGHEHTGRRPAVVLSPHDYNSRTSLAIFCPITSAIKGYPFEVIIPDNPAIKGVILSDQVKSLDWKARDAEFICDLDNSTLNEVLSKLKSLLS